MEWNIGRPAFTRSLAELEYADFVRHILVDKIGLKGLVVGYDHRFGKTEELLKN
ncbi:MAG: hypothetical protein ACLUOS_01960 [Odoribacter splanchnicus]